MTARHVVEGGVDFTVTLNKQTYSHENLMVITVKGYVKTDTEDIHIEIWNENSDGSYVYATEIKNVTGEVSKTFNDRGSKKLLHGDIERNI